MKNIKTHRQKVLRKLRMEMRKDKANPARVSKWIKLIECRKKAFEIDDEIGKIEKSLAKKPGLE